MAPGERRKDEERSDQDARERPRRGSQDPAQKRQRNRIDREEEPGERERYDDDDL